MTKLGQITILTLWLLSQWPCFAQADVLLAPAQEQPIAAQGQPAADPTLIELNFPENVELRVLVEYVSKRLGINILYDEQIGGKKVTIRASTPGSSLLGLPPEPKAP